MQVQRINLTGAEQAITFDTKCGKWLVKNFTEGDIFVSFKQSASDNETIKIQAGYGQTVIDNEYLSMEVYKHNTIYVRGTGEVEVQQLCYH